jgi:hypothetical protein
MFVIKSLNAILDDLTKEVDNVTVSESSNAIVDNMELVAPELKEDVADTSAGFEATSSDPIATTADAAPTEEVVAPVVVSQSVAETDPSVTEPIAVGEMTETEAVEPTPVESAPTVVADEVVDTSPVQALGKDFPVTGSTTIDSTMDSLPADAVAANEELAPSEPILHTFANLIPNAKSADATAPQQISADHAAAPGILEPTVESVLAPDQEGEFSMSTVESLSVEEPLAAKVAVIAPEPISTIEDAASDPNSVTSSTTDEEPLTVAELDAAVQDRVPTTEPGVPIADPEPTNAPPEPVPTSATLPTADVYQTASTGAPPAEVSAAKVDTLDESEANEQTPLASVVPLPAESQPQPFPLVLGNPE